MKLHIERASWTLLFVAVAAGQAAPLNIKTTTLPAGTFGVAYSQSLSAAGGTGAYTWSISAGALPDGLTMSGTGVISGTPQSAGTFQFTAKVSDADQNSDAQPLQITINSKPTITTAALPNATAGTPYSATLASSGAVAPVTWSISAGMLPAGLTLSGS